MYLYFILNQKLLHETKIVLSYLTAFLLNNVICNVSNKARYIYNLLLKMEHVETLPKTDDVLSPIIVTLFGILCPPAEKEECHFCLETITKDQFQVFKLTCSGHYTHMDCFKTWASASHTE